MSIAYDNLYNALNAALPAMHWFAISEAVKLCPVMHVACQQYATSPSNKTVRKRLKEAAEEAGDFLRRNPSPLSEVAARTLSTALTQIQLES